MRDVERALAEIGAIRDQLAKAESFHGLGPNAFAATGALALLAALGQSRWIAQPALHVVAWLALWIAVAAVSAGVIGFEMISRSRRLHSRLAEEMIWAAVLQFAPAAGVGALLTPILLLAAPHSLALLPGLWQVVFGLGVFASCRFLPKPMWIVGGWYVAFGLGALVVCQGPLAFSPWSMGLSYGIGQLLVAGVLRFAEQADA